MSFLYVKARVFMFCEDMYDRYTCRAAGGAGIGGAADIAGGYCVRTKYVGSYEKPLNSLVLEHFLSHEFGAWLDDFIDIRKGVCRRSDY